MQFPQITTTGVDLSRRLIDHARTRAEHLRLRNCSFFEGDAQALGDLTNTVDAVIASRLFLIVPNKEALLAEIFRVLRPGGRCFIAEPTRGISASLPLGAMRLLARLTGDAMASDREPAQTRVIPRPEFRRLMNGCPWASAEMHYDDRYQFAICRKSEAKMDEARIEAPRSAA